MKKALRRAGSILLTVGGFLAAATAFAGDARIDPQKLAITERAVEYCGPIDPAISNKLREKVAEMVKGVTPDALARIRGSVDYKQTQSSMDQFISKIDPRNAKVFCANTASK